jgi:hypothetical protein
MSNKTRRKGQVFRRLTIGAILAPVLVISSCSDQQPTMPADAPGISRSEEYSFGSATQAEDWRAARTVLDQLEARFGQKSMRILARNLDSATDPLILKAHYSERLAGWTEMPLSSFAERAWAFALVSPNGNRVLAVEAIKDSEGAGGSVPLNILTNLDDDKARSGNAPPRR